MGVLNDYLANLISGALEGFDSMVARAAEVLGGGMDSWGAVAAFAQAILRPFCLIVIGICLLIEIAQVSSKVDIIKWEHGLKISVKMVLAVLFLDIAPVFLEACYAQAAAWVTAGAAFGGGSAFGATINAEIVELIGGVTGLWATIGLFLSVIILILAIQLCGLVIAAIAFGRMFELYVYIAVSPLPCAFFPLGDGSGGGFSRITAKFLRSFAAVCLQGVMMIICMRIFGIIMNDVIFDSMTASAGLEDSVRVSELCYTMLLGAIVLVMSVVKCGSWAKSILDAA